MFRRLARLVLVGALAASTLAIVGGGVAPAQTGPTGYTVGGFIENGGFDDCEFFSIDMGTGETTQISDGSAEILCADGLTFAPDGTLYAYTNVSPSGAFVDAQLVTIDLATGAQTAVGPLPNVFVGNGGMTFDAAGNLWLYVSTFVSDAGAPCGGTDTEVCLFQVDPATAGTQFVGSAPVGAVEGLAANCTPEVLALTTPLQTGQGSGTQLQRVDTATAALDPVVDLPDTFIPQGLDYDDAGELWAIAGREAVGIGAMEAQNIDVATGTTTHTELTIGGDPFFGFLSGLAISPISCPEPPPAPAPEVVLAPTFTG